MINNRIGFFFPLPVIIIGTLISFIGLISLIKITIFGILLIPMLLLFITSTYGIDIDYKNKLYREYESYLGFKRGNWKNLDELSFITVLKSRKGMAFYSQSNRRTSLMDDNFEVYLLNETHRRKILIQKFDNKELAKKYTVKISPLIDKEIVQFNPVVSKKTRNRRNSR